MNQKEVQKKYPKPLKDLTLLDRFLFDTAMSKPDICHNILSIIFGEKEISPVRIGIEEKSSEPYYNSRAVRLDLLAVDREEAIYDAEAQRKNLGYRASCRRSRLYQAHVDVSLLESGDLDFGKLNDVYIIFISPYDIFGYGKYKYTFRAACEEVPGLYMEDGAIRIFLNTHGKNDDEVSEELVEFLHYVENAADSTEQIQSPRVKQLVNQIGELKANQETGVKYMRYWEEMEYSKLEAMAEGREEGREEGRKEGREEGELLKMIKIVRNNYPAKRTLSALADILAEDEGVLQKIADIICANKEADNKEILKIVKKNVRPETLKSKR